MNDRWKLVFIRSWSQLKHKGLARSRYGLVFFYYILFFYLNLVFSSTKSICIQLSTFNFQLKWFFIFHYSFFIYPRRMAFFREAVFFSFILGTDLFLFWETKNTLSKKYFYLIYSSSPKTILIAFGESAPPQHSSSKLGSVFGSIADFNFQLSTFNYFTKTFRPLLI